MKLKKIPRVVVKSLKIRRLKQVCQRSSILLRFKSVFRKNGNFKGLKEGKILRLISGSQRSESLRILWNNDLRNCKEDKICQFAHLVKLRCQRKST